MAVSNSAHIGLSDLHVALITSDTPDAIEYETPIKLAPAVAATITPNIESVTDYGDDGPTETASSFGGIEVEIETTALNVEQKALLLGHKYENGTLAASTTDIPPYLALGFRSQKADGSYLYVWLYKGKFEAVELNHQTKGESVEFQHPTLRATFVRREFDDLWKFEGDSSDPDFAYADTWFDAVMGPESSGGGGGENP